MNNTPNAFRIGCLLIGWAALGFPVLAFALGRPGAMTPAFWMLTLSLGLGALPALIVGVLVLYLGKDRRAVTTALLLAPALFALSWAVSARLTARPAAPAALQP